MNLPVRKQDDLVRATKAGWIAGTGGKYQTGLTFMPMAHHLGYETESYAVCGNHRKHDVPSTDCSCGFYAVTSMDDIPMGGDAFLLDVELAGKIISMKTRNGRQYRAQWQRVLSATAPSWCSLCTDIPVPARYLTFRNLYMTSNHSIVAAACADHCTAWVSPEWVAGKLGTEIKGEFLSSTPPQVRDNQVRDLRNELEKSFRGLSEMMARRPQKVTVTEGATWQYFIPSDKIEFARAHKEGLMLEIAGVNGRLAFILYATSKDGARVLWKENVPL